MSLLKANHTRLVLELFEAVCRGLSWSALSIMLLAGAAGIVYVLLTGSDASDLL